MMRAAIYFCLMMAMLAVPVGAFAAPTTAPTVSKTTKPSTRAATRPTTTRTAATAPATAPVANTPPAVTDADVQAAAQPLVDFADWCAANKARSAGEKALESARTIVTTPGAFEFSAATLRAATDEATESADVAKRKQAAMDATVAALLALANRPHEVAADSLHDAILVKAVRLGPATLLPQSQAAAKRAVAAGRFDSAAEFYGLAIVRDAKFASSIEPALLDGGSLPLGARRAVSELVANDQGLAATTYLTQLAKRDARGFAAGKYQPCTDVLAARVFLVRIPTHAMVAYVSIPWKWSPAKASPVIFCFAGAGKEYKSICDKFHTVVGDGPYIVVSPVTLVNTNVITEDGFKAWYAKDVIKPFVSANLNPGSIFRRLQFDQPGVLAMVKAVREGMNTEEKIYITGFSGGGMPCYATMIASPELIAAAAPACANYYLSITPRGRSNNAPVRQFYGDTDPNNAAIGGGRGLIAQGQEAAGVLSEMGYVVAEPAMMPNVGHSAMAKEVVDYFNGARGKGK